METGLQAPPALSCCHATFRSWQEIWDGQICPTLGPKSPGCTLRSNRWCVCVYSDLTEWFCVCVYLKCVALGLRGSMLDQVPLPPAWSRVHYRWAIEGEKGERLFCFYPVPVISFSLSLFLFHVQRGKQPVSRRCSSEMREFIWVFYFPSPRATEVPLFSHVVWMFEALCPR